MPSIDRCLEQIRAVQRVAAGSEPAYVARSRLGRLTLSTVSVVASRLGLPIPDLPNQVVVPTDAPSDVAELAAGCNRLIELARQLSQPSEPLDARWKRGWSELLRELEKLEQALSRLGS